jgi:hypothetical protein
LYQLKINIGLKKTALSKYLKYKVFVILLLFLGSFNLIEAQKVLALDLVGSKLKRIKYYEGEWINIRIKNDKVIYKGELNAITDSSFFINNNYVALDSVDAIIKYSKAAKSVSLSAFGAAAVTGVFSALNVALNNGGSAENNPYFVPVIFTGIGVALLPFWKRTYRIGKNRILKVIDLSPV